MSHAILLETHLKFCMTQLQNYKIPQDNIVAEVVASLYRSIVELAEGVRIQGMCGLHAPSMVTFRSLLEASIAFEFIFSDIKLLERRAKFYKVSYHLEQVNAFKKYNDFDLNTSSEDSEIYKKMYDLNISQLYRNDLKEYTLEFKKEISKRKKSKRKPPQWYSINEGPDSINQLLKCIEKTKKHTSEISTPKLLSSLYSSLSIYAHAYLSLDGIIEVNKQKHLRSIFSEINPIDDLYNFGYTSMILWETAITFTKYFHKEYTVELNVFAELFSLNSYVKK